MNFDKVYPLCKDLPANPCREMPAGKFRPPASRHLKVQMLLQISAWKSKHQPSG
jgi:hypothetical protein